MIVCSLLDLFGSEGVAGSVVAFFDESSNLINYTMFDHLRPI